MSEPATAARVEALYISTKNAEAVVGQSWRWCRDQAKRLGVNIRGGKGGRKPFILAAEFSAALERAEPEKTTPLDPTAAAFAALGWELPK